MVIGMTCFFAFAIMKAVKVRFGFVSGTAVGFKTLESFLHPCRFPSVDVLTTPEEGRRNAMDMSGAYSLESLLLPNLRRSLSGSCNAASRASLFN
jgi:hypothetical protein